MKTIPRVTALSLVLGLSLSVTVPVQAQSFVYVTNFNSDNVSVINTATNTVDATVAVGSAPFDVAITPDGAFAYVTNSLSNNVSVIDTAMNTVVATVAVDDTPFGIAITPDGTFAYVANFGRRNVSVINTITNVVVATVAVGTNPYYVAITPDGTTAYVPNQTSDAVSVINTTTNSVTATVAVDNGPRGVAITPDGAFAYVANSLFTTVSVINTATNAVDTTVPVNFGSFGIAITPDGAFAYVGNFSSSNVSVINTATNTVDATVTAGSRSRNIVFTQDGAFAYVTNSLSDNVSVINTATNAVVATVAVDDRPFGIAITPEDNFVAIDFESFQVGDGVAEVNSVTSGLGATFDEGTPQLGVQFEVITDPNDANNQVAKSPTNPSEADILVNFSVPVDLVRVTYPNNFEGDVSVSLCATDLTGTAENDPCSDNDHIVGFDGDTEPTVLEISVPNIRSVSLESASGELFIDNFEFRPVSVPQPVAAYNLNNSFVDELGGPNIVSNGGTLEPDGYSFGPNQGLRLSNVLNADTYSVEMLFRVDDIVANGIVTKFIDFANMSNDAGWYAGNEPASGQTGQLAFFSPTEGFFQGPTQVLENDVFANVIVTRDGSSDEVVGYVNGVERIRFADNSDEAVFSEPDRLAQFFIDDVLSGQAEASAGFVDFIKIYDQPLTPSQAAALISDTDGDSEPDYADNCPAVFNPDQIDTSIPPDGSGDACVDPSVTIPPNADVDPTATIDAGTEIDQGVTVGAGADVGSDVMLDQGSSVGEGASVGDGAELDRNVEVGDGATIEPGVMLGQGVFIGPGAFVGANSIIGKNTVICAMAQVGADSDIGKNNFLDTGTGTLFPPTILGGINGAAPDSADCSPP